MSNSLVQSARLLLVDDDPTCIALLSKYFGAQGYDVASVKDGEQAISVLSDDPPDVIVTDIAMPKVDGLALLKRIRDNAEINWIPVIVLTARSLSDDRIRSLSAGANAFMVKPFQLSELSAQVSSLVQTSYHLRQSSFKPVERKMHVPEGIKLTGAELSVAKLVAQGLSNAAIAQQLITSKRTVESHISHMLRKTGLSNRTELSRWILEHGLA
jgi:DNA-binding NarL/FixJ family response regulator